MNRRDWDQEQVRTNPQVRLAFQVWDLTQVKNLARDNFLLEPDKETLINDLIEDWIWFFDQGFPLGKNLVGLINPNQATRYSAMQTRFSQLQNWIRENSVLIPE